MSIYPFWSEKLGGGKVLFQVFQTKRDQLDQWECSLKKLFHIAKCTDYVMMVTGRAHSPYGSDMRPTTAVFKWFSQFFSDRVALPVFSKTVAHCYKRLWKRHAFWKLGGPFFKFLRPVIGYLMHQVDHSIDFDALKGNFGTLNNNFGTWWRHRGSDPPSNHHQ